MLSRHQRCRSRLRRLQQLFLRELRWRLTRASGVKTSQTPCCPTLLRLALLQAMPHPPLLQQVALHETRKVVVLRPDR